MLYKLIITELRVPLNTFESIEMGEIFGKLYRENSVLTLGAWESVDDPLIMYAIVGYRDVAHYQEYVDKMKTNELYQETTRKYEKYRKKVTSVTLSMIETWLHNIDEVMLQHYLKDVTDTLNLFKQHAKK